MLAPIRHPPCGRLAAADLRRPQTGAAACLQEEPQPSAGRRGRSGTSQPGSQPSHPHGRSVASQVPLSASHGRRTDGPSGGTGTPPWVSPRAAFYYLHAVHSGQYRRHWHHARHVGPLRARLLVCRLPATETASCACSHTALVLVASSNLIRFHSLRRGRFRRCHTDHGRRARHAVPA